MVHTHTPHNTHTQHTHTHTHTHIYIYIYCTTLARDFKGVRVLGSMQIAISNAGKLTLSTNHAVPDRCHCIYVGQKQNPILHGFCDIDLRYITWTYNSLGLIAPWVAKCNPLGSMVPTDCPREHECQRTHTHGFLLWLWYMQQCDMLFLMHLFCPHIQIFGCDDFTVHLVTEISLYNQCYAYIAETVVLWRWIDCFILYHVVCVWNCLLPPKYLFMPLSKW